MASCMEDRLLGYKQDNYVSSSEDEAAEDGSSGDEGEINTRLGSAAVEECPGVLDEESYYPGPKTGPKGVLSDYKRYRQLQRIERREQEMEQIASHSKQAFTADPNKFPDRDSDDDLEEDDDFLQAYHQKRLQQMKAEAEAYLKQSRPKFGDLIEVSGVDFVESVDKEDTKVVVLVHIYDENNAACVQMNKCLVCLAKQYPYVKFCKLKAVEAGVSLNFKINALPTLQAYKNGILIGNFLRIHENLDKEFYAADVENFLIESDVLTGIALDDAQMLSTEMSKDEDSDFDLD